MISVRWKYMNIKCYFDQNLTTSGHFILGGGKLLQYMMAIY